MAEGEETIAVRLLIKGRVQGVGYRAWCMHAAEQLGMVGWVRNLRDGCVEALAQGPAGAVNDFIAACHSGPSFAQVSTVETTPAAVSDAVGFQQLPTA